MRKCENCFNGHYNSNPGSGDEYLYCDEDIAFEEEVNEDDCCENHRYYQGTEEEKNYIYYDEYFIAPGFLIVNADVKTGKVNSFLKFYNTNSVHEIFGIRAHSIEPIVGPKKNDNCSMEFSFRDIEDYENGLYNCFGDLCGKLNYRKVNSVGSLYGKTALKLEPTLRVVYLYFFKKQPHLTNYIDIIIGDKKTCEYYDIFCDFYSSLSKLSVQNISTKQVKKLILSNKLVTSSGR